LGTRTRRVGVRQEPECCGFATAGAEIGRPAYIVAEGPPRPAYSAGAHHPLVTLR
jgi:hypothetical protein